MKFIGEGRIQMFSNTHQYERPDCPPNIQKYKIIQLKFNGQGNPSFIVLSQMRADYDISLTFLGSTCKFDYMAIGNSSLTFNPYHESIAFNGKEYKDVSEIENDIQETLSYNATEGILRIKSTKIWDRE